MKYTIFLTQTSYPNHKAGYQARDQHGYPVALPYFKAVVDGSGKVHIKNVSPAAPFLTPESDPAVLNLARVSGEFQQAVGRANAMISRLRPSKSPVETAELCM